MGSGNVCLPAFCTAHHYTNLGNGRCTMFGMDIRSETEMTRALQKTQWRWDVDLPGLVESIHLVVLISSGTRIERTLIGSHVKAQITRGLRTTVTQSTESYHPAGIFFENSYFNFIVCHELRLNKCVCLCFAYGSATIIASPSFGTKTLAQGA